MNHDSPAEIRRTLAELGLTLKKRWGQNFLINPGVRDKILELVDPRPDETVWEIGPGLGCLTSALLGRCRLLVGFEIDHGLIRFLQSSFAGREDFALEAGDAVERWSEVRERRGVPDKVVGNLPYSAASAVIGSFAEKGFSPKRLVFTVQRELAARLAAAPGGKNYSSFSVLCQRAYRVREAFSIRPGSFYPAPQVTSTVVELEPRGQADSPPVTALFQSAGPGGLPQPAQDPVEQPAGLVLRLHGRAPGLRRWRPRASLRAAAPSSWGPSAWPPWRAAWPQRIFSSRSAAARVLRFSAPRGTWAGGRPPASSPSWPAPP